MGTRMWGEEYITNPFPYLVRDGTKIHDKAFKEMKQCFQANYKKWKMFVGKNLENVALST